MTLGDDDPGLESTSGMPAFQTQEQKSWLATTFAGSYFVESVLGEGAMGRVLLARDIHLERSVAIKVLKPDTSERVQYDARFRREARLLSRLSHPNIVTLYAFGTLDDGTGYIVMERIDGKPLSIYCETHTLLPFDVLAGVVDQICLALALAHREGIVHRDVKPNNVLLVPTEGPVPQVKVLDFGLAKPVNIEADPDSTWDALSTMDGTTIGTPAYMSPEQACGDAVDGRSDLYGLACLVTELLTGKLPFGDLRGSQMIMAHLNEPPRLPSQLLERPGFHPGGPLDSVLARALAKDREKRYPDVLAFAAALREALFADSTDDDPRQTGRITGAFADTQAEQEAVAAISSTLLAADLMSPAQPREVELQEVAVLCMELDQLWRHDKADDPTLIGDGLAIAATRVRDAIITEGGEPLGGLVGGIQGIFPAKTNTTASVESAVQAALTIRRHLTVLREDPLLGDGMDPIFRLGIEVGDVFVGATTDGQAIAHGDALIGARTMVKHAEAGEVRLSRRSYRLVRGKFRYRGGSGFHSQVGPAVIGRTDTVQTPETDLHGIRIPHVGRTHEAERIRAVVDDAMAGMPGGRVLVVGAQGIGKTRLVSETVEGRSELHSRLIYDSGRCTVSGHKLPYHPFATALRVRAGIVHDDDPAAVYAKVDALVEKWVLREGEALADVLGLVRFLRGVLEVEPHHGFESSDSHGALPDQKAIQEGFAAYYGRLLERAPVLLFVDDFMYATLKTRELVHFLTERFADAPFTTILCTRESAEDAARTALELGDGSPPVELELMPLSTEATEQLVAQILHKVEALPQELVSAIVRLASGVPHIVVEAIFDLVDTGAIRVGEDTWFADRDSKEAVKLPESAEQLFRDRVERLQPSHRDIVQIAAVAGDVFWPDLLHAMALTPITNGDIENLVERGFFSPRPNAIIDGDQGYGFSQIAMAESAYRHIPGSRRRRLHGEIAAWLEEHVTDSAHPIDALIGTHYRLAQAYGKALSHLVRCANRAVSLQTLEEAVQYIRDCLEILPHVDDQSLGPPERESLTRDLAVDLAEAYLTDARNQDAADCVQTLLGPGGALAGTDAVANCRLLLARADALAKLDRHEEARMAYRSVERLLASGPPSARVLRAQMGVAVATRHLDGQKDAEAILKRTLGGLDMTIRKRPEVARVVAEMENELLDLQSRDEGTAATAAPT